MAMHTSRLWTLTTPPIMTTSRITSRPRQAGRVDGVTGSVLEPPALSVGEPLMGHDDRGPSDDRHLMQHSNAADVHEVQDYVVKHQARLIEEWAWLRRRLCPGDSSAVLSSSVLASLSASASASEPLIDLRAKRGCFRCLDRQVAEGRRPPP